MINKLKNFVNGAAQIASSEDWDEGLAQEFISELAELKPEFDKYNDNIENVINYLKVCAELCESERPISDRGGNVFYAAKAEAYREAIFRLSSLKK